MKQGNLTVVKYEKEFSRLNKYAPELVLTKTFRCRQFEDGLKESIKTYLTTVTSLKAVNFYQPVQAAMKIEKSKMKSHERNWERKFFRDGSSSDKRTRESQVDSMQGSATRGRRQGLIMTQGFCKGISTGQDERPECPHCHKNHYGICRRVTRGCFRCGSMDHMIENCLQGAGISRNSQGSSKGDQMYLH